MQDYKSLFVAVTICDTLINTQRQRLTGLYSWAIWAKASTQLSKLCTKTNASSSLRVINSCFGYKPVAGTAGTSVSIACIWTKSMRIVVISATVVHQLDRNVLYAQTPTAMIAQPRLQQVNQPATSLRYHSHVVSTIMVHPFSTLTQPVDNGEKPRGDREIPTQTCL